MNMTIEQLKDLLLVDVDLHAVARKRGITLWRTAMTLEQATQLHNEVTDSYWAQDTAHSIEAMLREDLGADLGVRFSLGYSQGDYAHITGAIPVPQDLANIPTDWIGDLYLTVADLPNKYKEEIAAQSEYDDMEYTPADLELVISEYYHGRPYFQVLLDGIEIDNSDRTTHNDIREDLQQFNRALYRHIRDWYEQDTSEEAVRQWAQDNEIWINEQ